MDGTVTGRRPQARPGGYRLPFGAHAGSRLDEVPVDYLATLAKAGWLWEGTRRRLREFLLALVKDPGRARLPFGKHAGEELGSVGTGYLDWLPSEWLGDALRYRAAKELRRRSGVRLVYEDPLGAPVGVVDH